MTDKRVKMLTDHDRETVVGTPAREMLRPIPGSKDFACSTCGQRCWVGTPSNLRRIVAGAIVQCLPCALPRLDPMDDPLIPEDLPEQVSQLLGRPFTRQEAEDMVDEMRDLHD